MIKLSWTQLLFPPQRLSYPQWAYRSGIKPKCTRTLVITIGYKGLSSETIKIFPNLNEWQNQEICQAKYFLGAPIFIQQILFNKTRTPVQLESWYTTFVLRLHFGDECWDSFLASTITLGQFGSGKFSIFVWDLFCTSLRILMTLLKYH